jgi:hypothetical protein
MLVRSASDRDRRVDEFDERFRGTCLENYWLAKLLKELESHNSLRGCIDSRQKS